MSTAIKQNKKEEKTGQPIPSLHDVSVKSELVTTHLNVVEVQGILL